MVQVKEFLGDDFLLETDAASRLYHDYAAQMPIIDYHNHLPPKDIATNRKFENITEVWLEGDHYKWRAMRTNGVPEKYCTGSVGPKEKFMKWAETVPATMRNPLYHWTHLELKRYFGITKLLNESTANDIYEECSSLLSSDEYRVQGLFRKMNVEVVGTTDDPADSLEYHAQSKSLNLKVRPTFRPDKSYTFHDPAAYKKYLSILGESAQVEITSLVTLLQSLSKRVDFFNSLGCRASDHGLERMPFAVASIQEADSLFNKVLSGQALNGIESEQLRTYILLNLSEMYCAKNWVQQFHLGAMRNNNSRLMHSLGADSGFDSIGDFPQASTLSRFLDSLDSRNQLAKTILYNLNPADNEVFATILGNFNDGSIAGKMQYGSGWWFLDQKDGMEKQLTALSAMGLLSRFVGMITDSRSFLSFPRHEYFRRILCNMLGHDVEKGELPDDWEQLGKMVKDICYMNAKNYFNF
jgi:glucuronate isomerase